MRIGKEISRAHHGKLDGPFEILIRVPELAEKASRLGTFIRRDGKLDRRLFELMVLAVARSYKAQFEWFKHEPLALKAGISPEVVEAIRTGRVPKLAHEDEKLVYDIVREINDTRTLSQKSYDRAFAMLGQDLLIELIAATGFYSMVATLLNVFDMPLPIGQKLPLS